MNINSFRGSFADGVGTIRAVCACGKEYYCSSALYAFEEGEVEQLESDKDAIRVNHTIEFISFEGQTFVDDCECWRPRAERVMRFLDSHMHSIAAYFKAERERKIKEAASYPSIETW